MKKRMQPILAALPKDSPWDFHFADAPYAMPSIGRVAIVDGDPNTMVDFGGPAVPDKPAEAAGTDPEEVDATQLAHRNRLDSAVRSLSLVRAADTEAWSDTHRPDPRNRPDLQETRYQARATLRELEQQEPGVIKAAGDILDNAPPSAKQGRWWVLRSRGNTGIWNGEEYSLAWIAAIMKKHGPLTDASASAPAP